MFLHCLAKQINTEIMHVLNFCQWCRLNVIMLLLGFFLLNLVGKSQLQVFLGCFSVLSVNYSNLKMFAQVTAKNVGLFLRHSL